MAKKKTVRKTTRKKAAARSSGGAVPSPAVVAKKMKKRERSRPRKPPVGLVQVGTLVSARRFWVNRVGLPNRLWLKKIRNSRYRSVPIPTPSGMRLPEFFAWGTAPRYENCSIWDRRGNSCRPRFNNGGCWSCWSKTKL